MHAEGIKCVKNVTIHSAAILSINAGEHWLGVGAADNSMSLFHRPQERLGSITNTGSKMSGWQLYRTPQKTSAVVCLFSPYVCGSCFHLFSCFFYIYNLLYLHLHIHKRTLIT